MALQGKINYYCFNLKCKNSIFFIETCSPVSVTPEAALDIKFTCPNCFQELVSKHDLNIKIQLRQLLNVQKIFKSLIIHDDPNFHAFIKQIFKKSGNFDKFIHRTTGETALNYLYKNKNAELPDFIFIDINTPATDIWQFLNVFKTINPLFNKIINIYIVSSEILPYHIEKIKEYPNVKGVITNNFSLSFLSDICL
jgi:CheY-like chemotaxis protein